MNEKMEVRLNFSINSEECQEVATLRVERIGREACKMGKKKVKWKGKWNSLHFVQDGRGVIKLGDKEFRLKAGMCFLLYAGVEYEYYPDKSNPWKYDWIDFSGEGIDTLLSKCGFSIEQPYVQCKDVKYFTTEFNELYKINSAHFTNDICVVAQVFRILSGLISCNDTKDDTQQRRAERFWRIRDCVMYMNSCIDSDLTLQDIAKANHISVSYMMAIWAKEVGMTPMDYLHRFRISEACIFLKRETSKVKDIAKRVGYADEKYFMRVFKKYKGVTPLEYRKHAENEDPFRWAKDKNIDFRVLQ